MLQKLVFLVTSSLLGWPQSVEDHIAALEAEDLKGRLNAARALEKLGSKASPAIAALIEGLSDDRGEDIDIRVGTLCAKALVAIGKPAREPILTALKSEDTKQFTGAAQALMFMNPPPEEALPVLFEAVRQRDFETQKGSRTRQRGWVATEVLIHYREKAKPVEFQFTKMLASDNFRLQISAARALGAIGPTAYRAVPALIKLTEEGNASARSHACLSLSRIGVQKNVDIVKPIEKMTGDYSAVVRERAFESLANLGGDAKAALPTVQELLRKKSFNNRVDAAYAAYRISGDATEPMEVLVELAGVLDFELDALQMLGKMGPAAKECVPALLEMLDAKDPDKRFEIVQTLRRVAVTDRKVIVELTRLARTDPNAEVRRVARLHPAVRKTLDSNQEQEASEGKPK